MVMRAIAKQQMQPKLQMQPGKFQTPPGLPAGSAPSQQACEAAEYACDLLAGLRNLIAAHRNELALLDYFLFMAEHAAAETRGNLH